MENDLEEELNRRQRAVWAAFGPLKEATDQLTEPQLRIHLFDSTVLPALCYAAETWPDCGYVKGSPNNRQSSGTTFSEV
ncbi:unnamed protein product [Strongylus vulgaris]|uniref:Uncharacterized protein n=1 Tax=Strongylus vulgaris TaxID=40348 RepID=A0A3P7L9L2_STRVU|nr:unnamed protein product [Strongylus vulgaris]